MKRYEILEHRADLKIKAFGKTKENLFLNAMLGMESCLRPKCLPPGGKHIRNIKIESLDINALLVDFLSEALYLIQTNKEIYKDIKFKKFSDARIEAELFGQKVASFGEEIKAVTHHALEIKQNPQGFWEAVILFDI